MKVKSYISGEEWLDQSSFEDASEDGSERPNLATQEINRVLSDVVRSENLIVLTGLGTSLCVKDSEGNFRAPTMGALWKSVSASYALPDEKSATFAEILAIVKQPEGNENIEELLSRAKVAENFIEGDDQEKVREFIGEAEKIIRDKVDFLENNDDLPIHEAFLRRLARRSVRRERLKVFTTNYDRCFEHAAQRSGFVVIDGFTFSQPSRFDPMHFNYDVVRRGKEPDAPDYIENLFQLFKVHGSIDWEFDETSKNIFKNSSTHQPLLIYPRNTKYEMAFAQPYLEMISSFQTSIRKDNTALLVVGFGFNDNHIAEPIIAAIENNLGLKVAIIAPDLEVQCGQNPHLSKISGLIDRGDARLSLINATFENIVPMIPDITATTELERHSERVRAVRER